MIEGAIKIFVTFYTTDAAVGQGEARWKWYTQQNTQVESVLGILIIALVLAVHPISIMTWSDVTCNVTSPGTRVSINVLVSGLWLLLISTAESCDWMTQITWPDTELWLVAGGADGPGQQPVRLLVWGSHGGPEAHSAVCGGHHGPGMDGSANKTKYFRLRPSYKVCSG